MDNVKQHESLLRQIHDTYIKKNHDYGDSFSRSFKKYGLVAAMVRMEDKWNRLDNMASGAEQKVADETIRDTLLDLAGYCVMTTMELDRQKDFTAQRAFEEQVRDIYTNGPVVTGITKEENVTTDDAESVVIHDEENGDIEVNVPEKVAKAKKSVDEGKVMALHRAKWSQAKIADEMGCSQSKICQIIKANKE